MSPRKAPEVRSNQPFDEDGLRSLFRQVNPPSALESGWRDRVSLIGDGPARRPDTWRRPSSRRWAHALAATIATAALGGGVVAVISVNTSPSPDPQPTIVDTPTVGPTTSGPAPSISSSEPVTVPTAPSGEPPPAGQAPPVGGPPASNPADPAGPPDPGPLTGWPDSTNVGVPAGTKLRIHSGDLHVTTPGAVISDLRVAGTIFVEAPDVTLRRVLVAPPSSATAGVRQLAPRLTIEHSEITGLGETGQSGIVQQAAGLTVRRTDVHTAGSAIVVGTDASIVDSYLHSLGSSVYTNGNSGQLRLRHNRMSGSVVLGDDAGAVTDVTVENNLLEASVAIWAPRGAGSRDIRVNGNQFRRGGTPSSGWNGQAPGNAWTGNVWSDTGEPVNP